MGASTHVDEHLRLSSEEAVWCVSRGKSVGESIDDLQEERDLQDMVGWKTIGQHLVFYWQWCFKSKFMAHFFK